MNLSESLVKTMKEWVELHLGHKIADSRMEDFEKRILLASLEAGYSNANDFVTSIIRGTTNEQSINYISLYLTIGETYFFRDPLSYSVLRARVLPELIDKKESGEKISIWSAGCSSGEEPYSLAMTMLSELKSGTLRTGKKISSSILATDINRQSLDVAKKGIYRRWSFRDIPGFIKDKYFTALPNETYHLKAEVKKMVNFTQLNLAQDNYPSILNGTEDLDIIFCRNVLIYFSPETVTSVLNKFYKCLKNGGWLFLAPSEIPHPAPSNFEVENINGAIALRKKDNAEITDRIPIKIVTSNFSYFGHGSEDQETSHSIDNLIDIPTELDKDFVNPSTSEENICALDPDTLDEQVLELYTKGDYKTIIDSIPQIPELSELSSTETLGLIARAYANVGNLESAVDWCERLITQDTVNPRWYYLKATIHHELSEDDAALRSLKQAIFLDQDYVIAYFVLGNLHRQNGNDHKSDKCFSHVAKLLDGKNRSDIVLDSDGLTVGQLASIVSSLGGEN